MANENGLSQMLSLRDSAKSQLMQIKSVEDGISYLNKLAAIETWVKAEKKDAELQNLVAEQKIRTQRILGELLAEGKRKGIIATPKETLKQVSVVTDSNHGKNLDEIGISKRKSSAFQQIASIPEQDFEEFIEEKKAKVNEAVSELTTSGAVRLAQSFTNKNKNHDYERNPEHENEVRELLKRINALPAYFRLKVKQGIKRC